MTRSVKYADKPLILAACKQLFEPGQVVELRCPMSRRTDSGYFNDFEALAESAAKLNESQNVYVTINPCEPALIARATNRIEQWARDTTTDAQIVSRRWLPIDVDPIRPKGVASTNEQFSAAQEIALAVGAHFEALGSPPVMIASSGNGFHVNVRVDLPNDSESLELVGNCLSALHAMFSTDAVKIDQTSKNAARIWKLYGTYARKGDDHPMFPHRLARITTELDTFEVCARAVLEAFAAKAPKQETSWTACVRTSAITALRSCRRVP